jgi:uncharacterized protein YjiK
MRNLATMIYLLLSLFVTGCTTTYTDTWKVFGYNLSKPDVSFILPDTLREISGLTDIDSNTFACVQDENGILFIYNTIENNITNQYKFNIDGDYEGITRISDTMYVLRSEGTLFEIADFYKPDFTLTTHETGIPAKDNEGLCYDPDRNRLLIACKGKIGKDSEFKDKRVIYEFDLQTKKLTKKPAFAFDLNTIKAFAIKNKLDIPTRKGKKKGNTGTGPNIKFKTSAIAIHPVTKKLFLLSAADYLLFIFNMDGEIEHIEQLDPAIFNKAEGITFLENNDMLIANEGQDGKPTLLIFHFHEI